VEEGELGHGHPFVGEEETQAPWLKTGGLFPRVFGSSVPWAGQSGPLQTSGPTNAWPPTWLCPQKRPDDAPLPELNPGEGPSCSWRAGRLCRASGQRLLPLSLSPGLWGLCTSVERRSPGEGLHSGSNCHSEGDGLKRHEPGRGGGVLCVKIMSVLAVKSPPKDRSFMGEPGGRKRWRNPCCHQPPSQGPCTGVQ